MNKTGMHPTQVAAILKKAIHDWPEMEAALTALAFRFAAAFAEYSPSFDQDQFMKWVVIDGNQDR